MGSPVASKRVEKGGPRGEAVPGVWVNHANFLNTSRTGNGPRLDKGMGALVKDLVDRGMWQNTVVLWMGEFCRTPRINQNNGRDPWARSWAVVLGGGAVNGGQAAGASREDRPPAPTLPSP